MKRGQAPWRRWRWLAVLLVLAVCVAGLVARARAVAVGQHRGHLEVHPAHGGGRGEQRQAQQQGKEGEMGNGKRHPGNSAWRMAN